MKIVFIGTGEWGVPALKMLADSPRYRIAAVVTQPDRPAGRQLKLAPSPIKQQALALHLKVYQPEKINHKSALEQIKYEAPDLIVTAAYGQILSRAVLNLAPLGCLNIHGSLLPKYRGASPIAGAIAAGEKKTGVTIMWMDEGLDTGDILIQKSTSIQSKDNAETVHDRLSAAAAPLLMKALELIEKNKAPRIPQDPNGVTITKKLRKEEGRLDWSKKQVELDWHIRAMTPWPGAYSWLGEGKERKMLKIFDTILSNRAKGKPGEVVRVDKHGILVAAGKGGLLLRDVQAEGKKRMSAADFARGANIKPGILLG